MDNQPIDHVRYLDEVAEAAARADCAIHAYVLMTNHVQLPATPGNRLTSEKARISRESAF